MKNISLKRKMNLEYRRIRNNQYAYRFENSNSRFFAGLHQPGSSHTGKGHDPLRSPSNAFTLGEVLLALMVCVLCASLMSAQTSVLKKALELREDSQEQFAIVQLREMSAAARRVTVQGEKLILETPKKTERVEFDQHRLVKRDGYMILMEQIDSARFYAENESIYLEVQYGSKRHVWQIR